MFSFEAGRRCASGEGYFEFETSFGCEIFQVIQCAIEVALNKASLPTDHEQHHEDLSAVPRQAERSVYLTVSASLQPPLCPQNKVTTNSTIPESEYAVPFDKVAQNLLATGFGGLLGPSASAQKKPRKPQKPENISDDPEVSINPVYDEPEVIREMPGKCKLLMPMKLGMNIPIYQDGMIMLCPRAEAKCQVEEAKTMKMSVTC